MTLFLLLPPLPRTAPASEVKKTTHAVVHAVGNLADNAAVYRAMPRCRHDGERTTVVLRRGHVLVSGLAEFVVIPVLRLTEPKISGIYPVFGKKSKTGIRLPK